MPTITDHYGISGPVPFINVETDSDNGSFVDPHAIRLAGAPEPFASAALDCIDGFFKEITSCVLSNSAHDRKRAMSLLQPFAEPWETRLGMSAHGFQGHGGAADVGTWIWGTLVSDVEALVQVGVLRHLEDLPLFVEGIDRDITSDITTRLIFAPLAEFTAQIIREYPEFTSGEHEVRPFQKQVWDASQLSWMMAEVWLPVVEGKPLLLVPNGWARKHLLMSATRFFQTSVLSFAQLEEAVLGVDGKLVMTPKDRLIGRSGLERGRRTNLQVTLRAFRDEQDLLEKFKAFVASRFDDPNAIAA